MDRRGLTLLLLLVIAVTCWEYGTKEGQPACVSMTGDLTFKITYNKTVGDSYTPAVYEETVPHTEGVIVTGQCEDPGNNTSQLSVAWGKYTIHFEFFRDTARDVWYTTMIQLKYDESLLPDTPYKPEQSRKAQTTDDVFLTRQIHYYQCTSTKNYDLHSDVNVTQNIVVMTTSNLVINPLNSLIGVDKCSSDEKPTPKPIKPNTAAPKPKTIAPKPSNVGPKGSRVAWTCTILSLLVLTVCAILIYINREGTPSYLRVV